VTFHLRDTESGLTLGTFSHIETRHAIAGRRGGVSDGPYASLNLGPRSGDRRAHVRDNLTLLTTALHLNTATLIAPRQVHSAAVSVHRRGGRLPERRVFAGDALVTDDDVALMLLAADCCALLIYDEGRRVCAAAHAGWRGTAGQIAIATVQEMSAAFGCRPADLAVGIGPTIGKCCYEVGRDVAEAVARASPDADVYQPRGADKALLDLPTANTSQLVMTGVDPTRIVAAQICTACRTDLFYSHRREGEPTGRFGTVISLRPPLSIID